MQNKILKRLKSTYNQVKISQFVTQCQNNYSTGNTSHLNLRMKAQDILNLPSTPSISPSYPFGPYRFIDREWFIVQYISDAEALRKVVPSPLVPNKDNIVLFEWINMPDSTGFGDYHESGTVIPCTFEGKPINYTLQMFLDCEPPIAAGREIWGFPKKYAVPKLEVIRDTLNGSLNYRGQEVAYGTMAYKYKQLDKNEVITGLKQDSCNLKVIPGVNGKPKICQLVGYNLEDVNLKEAWEGPARLELNSHVKAPTGELPIRKILGGKHIIADITLPYGRVLYDYMKDYHSIPKQTVKKFQGINFFNCDDFSNKDHVALTPSMPHISPMYVNNKIKVEREILTFRYLSCPEEIAKILPEPLIPYEKPLILLVWSNSNGTDGNYHKLDMFIPCYFKDELVQYNALSYVDQSSVRTENREKYGQPQKLGFPSVEVTKDTVLAKFCYNQNDPIAIGSMAYQFQEVAQHEFQEIMKIPVVQLKFIPGVEKGSVEIAQLTKMVYEDLHIHKCYKGPSKLQLKNHVAAPIKDVPIVKMLSGFHIKADYTIRKGQVIYDYLENLENQENNNKQQTI